MCIANCISNFICRSSNFPLRTFFCQIGAENSFCVIKNRPQGSHVRRRYVHHPIRINWFTLDGDPIHGELPEIKLLSVAVTIASSDSEIAGTQQGMPKPQ